MQQEEESCDSKYLSFGISTEEASMPSHSGRATRSSVIATNYEGRSGGEEGKALAEHSILQWTWVEEKIYWSLRKNSSVTDVDSAPRHETKQ